jgi:hypothetical protein
LYFGGSKNLIRFATLTNTWFSANNGQRSVVKIIGPEFSDSTNLMFDDP